MREAIEPLGWGCAFANDIAPKKAEMYRDRFGHSDLSVADVHDISTVDIPAEIDSLPPHFHALTSRWPVIGKALTELTPARFGHL